MKAEPNTVYVIVAKQTWDKPSRTVYFKGYAYHQGYPDALFTEDQHRAQIFRNNTSAILEILSMGNRACDQAMSWLDLKVVLLTKQEVEINEWEVMEETKCEEWERLGTFKRSMQSLRYILFGGRKPDHYFGFCEGY